MPGTDDQNASDGRPRNYSALWFPVDSAKLHEFKLRSRKSALGRLARRNVVQAVPVGLLMVALALVTVPIEIVLLASIFVVDVPFRVLAGILAAVFARFLWFLWEIFRRDVLGAAPWATWFRLATFARDNRMGFRARVTDPNHAGVIFRQGDSRIARDVMSFSRGRRVEIGNYRYVGEIGPRRVPEWGYLAIHLDRRLPHMVMESRLNRTLFGSRLPSSFVQSQVLSLEGDFNRHFTLYAPQTYERDALYIFTPDLMALLIDQAAAFDVEVVDDWMFVYSHRPFDMVSPSTYERADRIVDTLGRKTLRQTRRYADSRVDDPAANTIARPGRRLRVPINRVLVVGGIVYLAVTALGVITGIATLTA